jgi:hypothetical protein
MEVLKKGQGVLKGASVRCAMTGPDRHAAGARAPSGRRHPLTHPADLAGTRAPGPRRFHVPYLRHTVCGRRAPILAARIFFCFLPFRQSVSHPYTTRSHSTRLPNMSAAGPSTEGVTAESMTSKD